MKKPLLIPSLIILGLSLSSCNLLPFGSESETNNQSESASSQKKESSSAAQQETKQEEEKAEAEQPEPIQPKVSSVAGLKRATDPEAFLQQRGVTPGENRSDPFTLFPVPPEQEETPSQQQSEPNSPESLPSAPNSPSEAGQPSQSQPTLAQKVTIQGILQIGNQAVAILKTSDRAVSRYVRPGQLIANDQVLVKQINIKQRGTPTVVLEQAGVEVIKTLEEGMVGGATTVRNESSTGNLPPPPP